MTFDIFIVSRNISMDTKVNDFFCFLLKSELVWYLESSHLYHCRGWWPVSSLPAGVSASLLSDQTPPQYLSRVMTRRSCRKYYLKLDSNTGDTPAQRLSLQLIWKWKGWHQNPIIISNDYNLLKTYQIPSPSLFHFVIRSVRLHADNCCLVTLLNINTLRLEHPEHNVNIFLKG